MTKSELNTIINSERWPIKFIDFYRHYFYVLFPIGIIFIGTMMMYSGIGNNVTDLKITALIELGLGIFLLIFITKRLVQNQRFKNYKIQGVSTEIIRESIQKLNLKEFNYNEKIGYFSGITRTSLFSSGEKITIIMDRERLLINSRPIMGPFLPQPITIFKDRKNIKKIINEIKNTTANTQYNKLGK